ncbi:MAG: hypothetical protein IJ891_13245 [Prevotella sp.]|nr:hypothetical protein [Prevotella sp.]
MNKLLWIFLLACSILVSCNQKKSDWEIRQEQLKHKHDSLMNTNVSLSFMGIEIGGSVEKINEAIKEEKIKIDSCSNGIYIGMVSVPCMKDTTTYNLLALMRIGTLNNRVASIELVFENTIAFDFFKNTFSERYYDIDEFNPYNFDYNSKHCIWSFKEQTVRIDKKTHKEVRDVVVGSDSYTGKNVWAPREVDITDAISVEYLHNELHELLINSARREKSLKDSIENVEKEKVDQERINKAKENEMKYKDNI